MLRALKKKDLVPFMTQARIGSVVWKVGTALDILCVDLNAPLVNNVVSVQLKTYGPRNHTLTRGKFCTLFDGFHEANSMDDNLINRSLLQVMAEYTITQIFHNNCLWDARLLIVHGTDITQDISTQVKWYDMPDNYAVIGNTFGEQCEMLLNLSEEDIAVKRAQRSSRSEQRFRYFRNSHRRRRVR